MVDRIHRRHSREQQKVSKPQARGKEPAAPITRDIRALNASILIISQKMKYIVRNEKILGRNLLVLNKKLKELEQSGLKPSGGASAEQFAGFSKKISPLQEQLEKNTQAIGELGAELENVKANYAKAGLVKEIKYVMDSINPLEFVTYKEVEKIVGEKLKSAKKKK